MLYEVITYKNVSQQGGGEHPGFTERMDGIAVKNHKNCLTREKAYVIKNDFNQSAVKVNLSMVVHTGLRVSTMKQ